MTSASPITLPDSPCLLLDLDVFERNVARMVQTIVTEGGKRWRPHVKALRAPALALVPLHGEPLAEALEQAMSRHWRTVHQVLGPMHCHFSHCL
jgi:hypothetical protein